MNVRPYTATDGTAAYALLCAEGWAHRIRSQEQLEALVANSQRVAVAVAPTGELVGFARALTDGLSNGYLSMVVVASPWRRRGVGRAMVGAITQGEPGITWVLRAGREGAADFFGRLGFVPSTEAMERKRR